MSRMRITRPAIAAVAAVTIAAGTVPALTHLQAQPQRPEPAAIAPADSQTVTTLQPAPATSATSTTPAPEPVEVAPAPATPETDPVPGASVPDGDLEGIAELVDEALTANVTDEEMDNLGEAEQPVVTQLPTKDNVKPLAEAPKTYKGEPQAWFHNVKLLAGGEAVSVWSESMGREIPVAVIRATDAQKQPIPDAPTYYLLNGAGGSEQNTDWLVQAFSDVKETLEREPVNVVIPMEGAFSYYVDWLTEPEKNVYLHGKQMWSTFLGSELPYAIEDYLDANDTRAVSGMSMSATSSLLLAEHNPGRYAAVGSFSGCGATSTPLPSFFVGLTVNRGSAGKGGISPENLWGPRGSEYNRYNDALVMAERLRGTDTHVYLSSGTGLAGETDMIGYLKEVRKITSSEALGRALTLQVEGGAIEAAMNACTHDTNAKLRSVGVPVTFNQRPTGTHSWPLWKDDLRVSWESVIKPSLGL